MKVKINKSYKSISAPQEFNLPDFVVLTGKNGSGKTHLMEVLSNRQSSELMDEGHPLTRIKYIAFNGLNPQVKSDSSYMELMSDAERQWYDFRELIEKYEVNQEYYHSFKHFLEEYNKASNRDFRYLYNLVGENYKKIDEELFKLHYRPLRSDLFSADFASVFKLYHTRKLDNEFKKFLNEKHGESHSVLSEEEFEKEFGPAPWNLVNDILIRAHLPYRVNKPEGTNRDVDFHLSLKDSITGVEIQVNDLSTGEKVLMSLALSIYKTMEGSSKPEVLCIDEPDASLHPEFSKILVEAISESIVKMAGVKVIISTHSPSTVAIAPEESLYLMNKEKSMPKKITKQAAVNLLTRDIDNLRLSFENRRQVFVESKYDVVYYTRFLQYLDISFSTSPQFLPPKSSNGSNCNEVKDMVNALRRLGNDLVYGIKDFDNKNHSNEYVLVLGEDNRYAIDNYVFDPIFTAFLLVHERLVNTSAMGLDRDYKFVDLRMLTDDQIQCLIDYVTKELGFVSGDIISYTVKQGSNFSVDKGYFTIQGHKLEDKIKKNWPQLNKHIDTDGGDNQLKLYVLEMIISQYPQFISMDFIELFSKIK